jgi:hypothetical protein
MGLIGYILTTILRLQTFGNKKPPSATTISLLEHKICLAIRHMAHVEAAYQ